MKPQSGDQWVNELGDSIIAEDDGKGNIIYRLSYTNYAGRELTGVHTSLKGAKRYIVKDIRDDAEGADDWTMFYDEPRNP